MNRIAIQNRSSGNSIVVVLMVITTLSVAAVCALNLTSSVARNVNRTNHYRDAVEIGDGALDYLYAHWLAKSQINKNVQLKGGDLADIPMPTADLFPAVDNFSATRAADRSYALSNVRIQGLDTTWNPIADSATVPPAYGMNEGTMSFFYLASADVTLRGLAGKPMQVNARRVLEKAIESPWMYAIFYTDRLEIHPGPEFHVTGWVHTNENLYTAHDTLWFESKVTFGQEWLTDFAPNDGQHTGETPKAPHVPSDLPPKKDDPHNPMGMKPLDFNATDSNPDNDSYRELIEKPLGNPANDPVAADRYYNQADVKITVDGTDASGNPIVNIRNHADTVVSASDTGTNLALYQTFKGAVTVGDKIQDNREGKEIRLITVDMSKVTKALQPGGSLYGKFNGVVYVSDQTATSSNRGGVRLKNGGIMPPGGVTVVSDNPVYIQGDYNTGTNGSTQPNSNQANGDPAQNTVPGYQKQSCAVVGDAVMILSNAWNDANSYKDTSSRQASPTTVNTAIISGIVPTGDYGTNYSGGAENFPRFMEKWGSGTTFTYYGSMVELFKSAQNTGYWGKGNVYDPPKRKWYFDRQFYTDPPPGTLRTIQFKKSRWYQE